MSRGRAVRGVALLVPLLVWVAVSGARAGALSFRFIGNQAFEITDGDVTLLTDFPYQSGYSIYMEYAAEELRSRGNALCLITHRHLDHLEPDLVHDVGCTIVGPVEVTSKLVGVRFLPLEERIRSGPISINPVATPHRDLEHYSYLVEWHGLRLYFVGDTETFEHVTRQQDLDVLFLTPWLAGRMARAGVTPPARKVVIYHHAGEEKVESCAGCLVPEQGATFRVDYPDDAEAP